MKSEDRIQQECYTWFHNTYPQFRGLLFHVPNGGSRNKREATKFKWMGVYSGVADLIFLWNGKTFMIELKNAIGTQSPKQKAWEQTVVMQGFPYYIVRTRETFIELILNIMKNE